MERSHTRTNCVVNASALEARWLMLLALQTVGLAFVVCSCSKATGPEQVQTHLSPVSQDVVAAVGGTVSTDGYVVEFPPGSLSGDTIVTVASPGTEPGNPSNSHLSQASLFMSVHTGSAAPVDTFFAALPYEGEWSDANPPVAIIFGADGGILQLPAPVRTDAHVRFAIAPLSERTEIVACVFDYVEQVDECLLTVAQGWTFEWDSSDPVVLLIHGFGGSAEDFDQLRDPEPTMRDFLYGGYGGRLWTWEYPSAPSIAVTGSALVEEIASLEAQHGPFPFKLHIVGHSRGGLEARYFVRHGGHEKVERVVFLGTPNDGARELAYLYHEANPPSRQEDNWINRWSLGFLDCIHGSEFLNELNTPSSWSNYDLHYFTIAGDYLPGNPFAPGADDHFISVSSVSLYYIEHEHVLYDSGVTTIDLYHGQLTENRDDGGAAGTDTYSDLFFALRNKLSLYDTEEPDSEITAPTQPSGTLTVADGDVVRFEWIARDPEEQAGMPGGITQVWISLDHNFWTMLDCPPDEGEWWFSSSVDPSSDHYIASHNIPTGGNSPHTFVVSARDVEGQWETPSEDPEDREVYVFWYNHPPSSQVLFPQPSAVLPPDFEVKWSGSDPDGEVAAYQYVLDPAVNAYRTCQLGYGPSCTSESYEDIPPGLHEFKLRAQDEAGCWEESWNIVHFYVEE